MPQVDLETLVCGGVDRKIACETFIDDNPLPAGKLDLHETLSDLPADSFWLSKDQEFDWFDRNAFYERKESTKGNSNSTNLNSNSSSQRFSLNLKSKASIIGLPKPQKSCYTDCRFRRNVRTANTRLFPKRSEPIGKQSVPVTEPSSPKVSCIGRVRSKKDRKRRRSRSSETPTTTTTTTTRTTTRGAKTGFWTNLKAIFRSRCKGNRAFQIDEPSTDSFSPPRKSVESANSSKYPASEPGTEPPGLGGLKRFASGRRSDAYSIGDVDQEIDDVSGNPKLESCGRDSLWSRREKGAPKEIDCGRDWVDVGPATV